MWNIEMPLFGFNNFANYGYNMYNQNFMNNMGYTPLFNFRKFSTFNYAPTLPMYNLPNFNFTGFMTGANYSFGGGFSTVSTPAASTVLSAENKTKIDDIRKLKYDDSNIMTKASGITDFRAWGEYLTGNKDLTVSNPDNNKNLFEYKDKDGNIVGTVTKENGKVVNICVEIDGGQFILNGSDSKINEMVSMTHFNEDNKNVGKTFKQIIDAHLKNEFKGVTPKTEERSDGTTSISYERSDGCYMNVIKDKSGKITDIFYASENTKTNQTLHWFKDEDGDGKVDSGEQKIRYDLKKVL